MYVYVCDLFYDAVLHTLHGLGAFMPSHNTLILLYIIAIKLYYTEDDMFRSWLTISRSYHTYIAIYC
jgi:hypothetical protein